MAILSTSPDFDWSASGYEPWWSDFAASFDAQASTSTRYVFVAPDGTRTVLNGAGFYLTSSGNVGWDSLTSAQHVGADNSTVYETMTFSPLPGNEVYRASLYEFLMAGNDTLNATAADSRLYGGAADDVFIVGTSNSTGYIIPPDPSYFSHYSLTLVGGTGVDTIRLSASDSVDLTDLDVSTIEVLEVVGSTTPRGRGTVFVTLSPDVLTHGLNTFVDHPSSFAPDTLHFVSATSSDLSSAVFQGPWGQDAIIIDGAGSILGTSRSDQIHGSSGDDNLNGYYGADRLTGGLGSDHFIFDAVALSDAQGPSPVLDLITDYDQSSGTFSAAEADQIDLSALLFAPYDHGLGQPAASLVRLWSSGPESNSNSSKTFLQVDLSGDANGADWVNIGQLQGLSYGTSVNVVLDSGAPMGSAVSLSRGHFTSSDFNGDARSDLVWRHDSGLLTTWEMGTHTATQNAIISSATTSDHVVATGDFNGDGLSDLAWRNGTAFSTWQTSDAAVQKNVFTATVGTEWNLVDTGDFNGDGRSDLVWRNVDGTITTWQMDGGSAQQNVLVASVGNDWHLLGAGDVNGDGRSDLIWRNDSGFLSVWQMNGSTSVKNTFTAQVSNDWKLAGVGDFNGDGSKDFLWRNDSGLLTTWETHGNTVDQNVFVAQVGVDWHVAQIGDYNADGKDDILWRNNDGTITTWLMNHDHAETNAIVDSVGTDWHLSGHQWQLV